ncbi:hypothetical protein ACDH60_24535 [Pseudomonas ficuserectae]|uniref:hypothetical protein n=1 Tax=Pseudomonas syringae group genomosp. 2 TaxID=251698 RepID=UPI0006CE06A6|nr:hypothetical protein [Pseudomonas amygdali]KPB97079.1 Uncharacterized protein AC501_4604 [Pseudomonas amygdali pv. lachrymans]RMM51287.1 hypothetical protein ALQ79_01143 [Pseudomonas amygdali pv. lachrymans]RMP25355.1 hypothetical protein ALQ26_01837 [Pseudomonas amygdali pv. lachrymans]WIO56648.1 hypothetical protein QO021_19105 [Pseudomonas amygdali pv. lachrymans]
MVSDPTPPAYAGKTTVYIDQNVIDMTVKGDDPAFFIFLTENFQILYSDDTLREIKRSGQPDKFLTALDTLKAMHIRYQLNGRFETTGQVILHKIPPVQSYSKYLQIEPVYDMILAAAHQTTLKLYGGRSDATFSDIASEQINAFEGLIKSLSAPLVELDHTHPDLRAPIEQYLQALQSQYEQISMMAGEEMTKHISDEAGQSGVKNYRATVGMGPLELNNIKPPRVIEKIWEAYQQLDGYRDQGFSIENFLGIATNPIYNREMHIHEKVTAIYNLLNVIGYKADSKLDREHRHVAAISDAAHAAIGAHAEILLSADRVFVDKVRATYEFLGVTTEVGHVGLVDGEIRVQAG